MILSNMYSTPATDLSGNLATGIAKSNKFLLLYRGIAGIKAKKKYVFAH